VGAETDFPLGNTDLQEALRREVADLDERLRELEEKEARFLTELQAIRIERKRYESLREHAEALLGHRETIILDDDMVDSTSSQGLSMPERADSDYPVQRSGRRRNSTGDTLVQAVYNILKNSEPSPGEPGEPMHYRDLVSALESQGIYVSGQDAGLNLVAHIHNDPHFFRPKRGVYGLKEWYPSGRHNVGERSNRKSRTGRSI
jgi:hypothetical protein